MKTISIEKCLPILGFNGDIQVSNNLDMGFGLQLFLPELLTQSMDQIFMLHDTFQRAVNLLPENTLMHKQDFFFVNYFSHDSASGGSVSVNVHPIQRLMVPDEFMGHRFSREEKLALLSEKRLEKTVELTGKHGKKDSYFLAIDPKTNELISLRSKSIRIPEKIKGVTLSQEQRQKLAAGKKIVLDEMTGRNG